MVGQSRHDVEDCRTHGDSPHRFKLDFFGGTMFWVRPEALRPLRDLRLASEMPCESGLIDGDLPHALERVLPTSVLAAGYKLADTRRL